MVTQPETDAELEIRTGNGQRYLYFASDRQQLVGHCQHLHRPMGQANL